MERNDLTRSYLETLSSTDLIALSDDFGIEAENLARCFIITEILDTLEDHATQKAESVEDDKSTGGLELPFTYNENKIVAVLRNPAWCYVTWDFKHETLLSLNNDDDFESYIIRLSYHPSIDTNDVSQTVDLKIDSADREQFVLLTSDAPAFHVSLMATFDEKETEILATSQRIIKPRIPLNINLAGLKEACSPLQTLSGLQTILKTHYNEHRHSFVRD